MLFNCFYCFVFNLICYFKRLNWKVTISKNLHPEVNKVRMKTAVTVVCSVMIVCCLAVMVNSSANNALARGFGDNVDWVSYEVGLEQAKETGKPMMILLHKAWCGACKSLKPKVAASKEFAEISKQFVVVNAENDEAPHSDTRFQVSRLFFNSNFFLMF